MTLNTIRDLQIEHLPVASLSPYANNPRTHSKKQISQLAGSIKAFGWTNPILIDDEGGIIAGHGRALAAILLGLDQVPVIRLGDMTSAQKRAYIIADNKLAENSGWDDGLLRIELEALIELDLDFEIETIGFETGEIDFILAGGEEDAAETPTPAPAAGPAVSRIGDLWHLSDHRLLCGDALCASSYEALLGETRADAVFTDPPYNVPISGHVSGLGRAAHDEFIMASGEMTGEAFAAFLTTMTGHLTRFSKDGSVHFICMDWRHADVLMAAGAASYNTLLNVCVWNKSNGGMGSLYRSKHEFVFVYRAAAASHTNNVELGRHGRNRTNVWDYAGISSFSKDRSAALAMHPTVKPVALVADAILDVTRRGGLVLDPFSGSGTTILAAEKTGRWAAAIELDPKYVDVTIRRFETEVGKQVIHEATGKTFSEIASSRIDEEAEAG